MQANNEIIWRAYRAGNQARRQAEAVNAAAAMTVEDAKGAGFKFRTLFRDHLRDINMWVSTTSAPTVNAYISANFRGTPAGFLGKLAAARTAGNGYIRHIRSAIDALPETKGDGQDNRVPQMIPAADLAALQVFTATIASELAGFG